MMSRKGHQELEFSLLKSVPKIPSLRSKRKRKNRLRFRLYSKESTEEIPLLCRSCTIFFTGRPTLRLSYAFQASLLLGRPLGSSAKLLWHTQHVLGQTAGGQNGGGSNRISLLRFYGLL